VCNYRVIQAILSIQFCETDVQSNSTKQTKKANEQTNNTATLSTTRTVYYDIKQKSGFGHYFVLSPFICIYLLLIVDEAIIKEVNRENGNCPLNNMTQYFAGHESTSNK
jgi:hypothetical protein